MIYLAFLMSMIFSQTVYASPAEEIEEFRIPMLDRVQEMFGTRFNFAANRLDSFFATERADDELGRSRIRIRSRFILRENVRSDLSTEYRINLKLPHLEEKFKYEYYQEKNAKRLDESEAEKAVRLDKLNRGWIFNTDLGVNATIPPTLTARARLRRSFKTGTLVHRFVEQITYVTDTSGFVHDTSINSDHTFSEQLLFRFINAVRWRINEKEFLTQHGPTFLQQLTDNDALNYGAQIFSTVDGPWYVNNYQLSINYRRNIYRQWLYFDAIPGIDFPKIFSFKRTPFIVFQLEMLLGR